MRKVEVPLMTDLSNAISEAANVAPQGVHVTVQGSGGTSGWTADAVTHPEAPTQLYYADLDHGSMGLVTEEAFSPSARAYNNFVFTNILYQQRQSSAVLRVWIHKEPVHDMVFKVLG